MPWFFSLRFASVKKTHVNFSREKCVFRERAVRGLQPSMAVKDLMKTVENFAVFCHLCLLICKQKVHIYKMLAPSSPQLKIAYKKAEKVLVPLIARYLHKTSTKSKILSTIRSHSKGIRVDQRILVVRKINISKYRRWIYAFLQSRKKPTPEPQNSTVRTLPFYVSSPPPAPMACASSWSNCASASFSLSSTSRSGEALSSASRHLTRWILGWYGTRSEVSWHCASSRFFSWHSSKAMSTHCSVLVQLQSTADFTSHLRPDAMRVFFLGWQAMVGIGTPVRSHFV